MPDIFDEVSEDLRAEKARALLRRYGIVLVGLMLLTLAGVGLYDWQETQTGQTKSAVADRFIAAQDSAGKSADNPGKAPPQSLIDTFAGIAGNGPAGYRVLAGLQLAALDWDARAARQGDRRVEIDRRRCQRAAAPARSGDADERPAPGG